MTVQSQSKQGGQRPSENTRYGNEKTMTKSECSCPYADPRPADVHRGCLIHGDALEPWQIQAFDAEPLTAVDEVKRLRRVMAAALERVQVDDCLEAEHILSLEVNLDGSAR